MKNLLSILILLIFCQLGHSQQMPLDFTDTQENFTGFSGSGFSFRDDPDDNSNRVGQFFNDASTVDQGFFLDLTRAIDLNFQKTISLSFYAFDPNAHTITMKLERGANADVQVTQNVQATGWTDNIVFDFARASLSSDGTPIDASGTYRRITIFIDVTASTSGTYLLDSINDGSTPTNPNDLDVVYDYLVWSDDFDTDGAANIDKWFHQTQLPAGGSWFNGELQHYTNRLDNTFVENGFLNIMAKRERFTDQGETKDFTSARLNSKFAFTYGRVDVRAKLPRGAGTWPAIWTLGKNINEDGGYWDNQGFGTEGWPACGEIDIMEHGLGAVNKPSSAIHTPSSSGNTVNTSSLAISDVTENFHIYSVNWSPNQITFLIDGEGYYTYNPAVKDSDTWPFDLEQYLLLNIAMGGFAGNVDRSFIQSPMIIDYVKVYQKNPTSISEFQNDLALDIYPNPVADIIQISSADERINHIVLYDAQGKKVLRKTIDANTGELEVSELAKGIYFLHAFAGRKSGNYKILVE
ncbi:MAG: family 16 glycosylhydrolase [Bacteroidia bacterium]